MLSLLDCRTLRAERFAGRPSAVSVQLFWEKSTRQFRLHFLALGGPMYVCRICSVELVRRNRLRTARRMARIVWLLLWHVSTSYVVNAACSEAQLASISPFFTLGTFRALQRSLTYFNQPKRWMMATGTTIRCTLRMHASHALGAFLRAPSAWPAMWTCRCR